MMSTRGAESADPSTAVVTGAASGMGLATTSRFLREGWMVVALDLDPAPLEELHASHPDTLIPVEADVASEFDIEHAIAAAVSGVGSVRAVVPVAGIYPPTTLETSTTDLYRRIFDVNVLGTVNVLKATTKYLRANPDGGNIVTFASVDAFAVSPGQLLYSASKAAVVSLTRSLAIELAPDGIVVNGVAPGWVETAGTAANDRLRAAVDRIPLGRVAQPEEIADWVWRLGSGENRYMTGETLFISGGAALR